MNGYLIMCLRKGGQPIISIYDHNQKPYDSDDDEQFYEETVYNEEYYIEREQELIRQSNLDLELEELEEKRIREMREEGLPSQPWLSPARTSLKMMRRRRSIWANCHSKINALTDRK